MRQTVHRLFLCCVFVSCLLLVEIVTQKIYEFAWVFFVSILKIITRNTDIGADFYMLGYCLHIFRMQNVGPKEHNGGSSWFGCDDSWQSIDLKCDDLPALCISDNFRSTWIRASKKRNAQEQMVRTGLIYIYHSSKPFCLEESTHWHWHCPCEINIPLASPQCLKL